MNKNLLDQNTQMKYYFTKRSKSLKMIKKMNNKGNVNRL